MLVRLRRRSFGENGHRERIMCRDYGCRRGFLLIRTLGRNGMERIAGLGGELRLAYCPVHGAWDRTNENGTCSVMLPDSGCY